MGWYLGCSSTVGSILWPPFASCHLGGKTLLMFSHLRLYINWKQEELLLPPPNIQEATANNTMSGKSTKATKATKARRGRRKRPDWSSMRHRRVPRVCHKCGTFAKGKEPMYPCVAPSCGKYFCSACFLPTEASDGATVVCHRCNKRGCEDCIAPVTCGDCGADYCSDCDEDATEECPYCRETNCSVGNCRCLNGCSLGPGEGPYPDPEEYNYDT